MVVFKMGTLRRRYSAIVPVIRKLVDPRSLSRKGSKSMVPAVPQIDMSLDNLVALSKIGEGSFGQVLLVRESDSKQNFALKVQSKKFLKDHKVEHIIKAEVEAMSSVSSPFVSKLYTTMEDENNIYLVLEYIPGGDLFSLINRKGASFDGAAHKFYAGCLIMGLETLHQNGIIYRDLKPENVLVDTEGYLKLVDFGFAKKLTAKGRTYTPCGTAEYFSPELIQGCGYGFASDLWSLGILIFELVHGHNPFGKYDEIRDELYTKIIFSPLEEVEDELVLDKACRHFLTRLLEKDEAERMGCKVKAGTKAATDFDEVKRHPWMKQFAWKDLQSKKMRAPWVPKINGIADTSNFDYFDSSNELIPANLHT